MMRLFTGIVLVAAIAALSCSGSEKPKPKSAPDEPAPSWSDDASPGDHNDVADDTSSDSDDDDDDNDDGSPPPKKPVKQEMDYDISYTDCAALAKTYGRVWRNAELKKLGGKQLKPKQQQAVEAEIHQNGKAAQDNWQSECDKTVGSPQVRSRLACALKAKTLERFNGCLDGLAE